jgi:hypothetical protein
MGLFKDFLGVVNTIFKIGGDKGIKLSTDQQALTDDASILNFKLHDDSEYATLRAGEIGLDGVSPNLNDLSTLFDLKGRVADIAFAFDGNAGGSIIIKYGTNGSGKFGFCYANGNGFEAKYIYYDKGAGFPNQNIGTIDSTARYVKVHVEVGKGMTTRDVINETGNVYTANWLYVLENISPMTWVKKCPFSVVSPVGIVQIIRVPFTADSVMDASSTPSVSSNSLLTTDVVLRTLVEITNTFEDEGDPVYPIEVTVGEIATDVTLLSTATFEFDNTVEGPIQYDKDEIIPTPLGGPVRVRSLTQSTPPSNQGSGVAYVIYGTPLD